MTSHMQSNPRRGAPALVALLLALSVLPGQAQGMTPLDVANLFGTTHGDGFTSVFMNQIFGPIFPSVAGGTSTTVFSTIIGYFNVIMLVIGGILFFYNATVGLLQSAHEGSVLGQRWSSLWAPLRILFAVGLLVPMPGLGGYNLVQAGVAYVVKGSTNAASAVWSTSANLVISGRVAVTTSPATVPPDVMRVLYENAACEAIVNHHMAVAAPSGSSPYFVDYITRGENGRITGISYLRANGEETRPRICGTFATPPLPDYIDRLQNNPNSVGGIPDSARAQIETAFASTHASVLSGSLNDLRSLTASMLPVLLDNGQETPDISAPIISIYQQANQRLSDGTDQIMDLALGVDREGQEARNALMARITGTCTGGAGVDDEDIAECYGEGWIGAGSWFMMIAQLNNEISSLTRAVPTAETGTYLSRPGSASDRELHAVSGGLPGSGARLSPVAGSPADPTGMAGLHHLMDRYMVAFDRSTAGLAALGFPMKREDLHTLSDGNASGALDNIPGLSNWVREGRDRILSSFSPGSGNFGADPMIGLSVLGQWLITGSGILLAAAVGTGFLSGGALGVMVMPLFVALLTAGATLSMLLPIMPFVFWVLAVTGYFILVIEAMIAVNLWAIAHMRMDGEGISGEAGRNGWLMILALLMTPVLMVFGFLIGMTLFRVTSALLDIGIFQALSGILGGSLLMNIIAIVTFGIFMAIFYMILLERSFSLVSEFPGRVLRWMGAGAQLTNGEEGKVRMAAAGAGLAIARGSQIPAAGAVRTAGALGVSRGGASGNPGGDPNRFGALRRALTRGSARDGAGPGPKSSG